MDNANTNTAQPLNPTLRVRLAEQYGRPVVHPVNQQAKWLAEIAGTKTLTPHAIKLARMMGFAVEYTNPDPIY